jgi:hypothetical protein
MKRIPLAKISTDRKAGFVEIDAEVLPGGYEYSLGAHPKAA